MDGWEGEEEGMGVFDDDGESYLALLFLLRQKGPFFIL